MQHATLDEDTKKGENRQKLHQLGGEIQATDNQINEKLSQVGIEIQNQLPSIEELKERIRQLEEDLERSPDPPAPGTRRRRGRGGRGCR